MLFGQPGFTLVWLIPVWIALGVCRFAILTIPLRFLYRCYGRDASVTAKAQPISLSEQTRARQIRDVVAIAARNTPWRSQCYPQALVAHLVLSIYQIPHVLYFGLRKADDEAEPYKAHAWVMAGDIVVTGGPHHRGFVVARAFVSGPNTDKTRNDLRVEERGPERQLGVTAANPGPGNAGSAHRSEADAFSTSPSAPCPPMAAEPSPKVI